MRYNDIKEGVGRITKQNQTVDVGPSEIKTQAAKFGNKVDKDGRPPTLSKKVKGSKTNVLFNLGMSESISVDNLYENVLYFRQMKENLGEIAQATEIYVDMDGVLADFFGEWAKLMKVDHY
jgi:3-polyprenyl-4-hydroxybenzoate decarboxylase